jgi:hypothetical protein
VFNVSFQRSYKDGETWKTSTGFGRSNLLRLSLVAVRAFQWIENQPRTLKIHFEPLSDIVFPPIIGPRREAPTLSTPIPAALARTRQRWLPR